MIQPSEQVGGVLWWSGDLPKAVIFDFDGVILESADIKTDAFIELFAKYPEHREAILQYHLENLGISRYRKFEWIFSELLRLPLSDEQSRRLGDSFSKIVLERVLVCPFVPGALDLVRALHQRCLLFIASGTPQEELQLIVNRRGLGHYFTEVWGSPRNKSDIISSILNRYALDQREVLFLGDGISDYEAAAEVGVSFFARTTHQMADRWRNLGVPVSKDLSAVSAMLESRSSQDR